VTNTELRQRVRRRLDVNGALFQYYSLEALTDLDKPSGELVNAKILMVLGDSVTTDHISPAGSTPETSSAGQYLLQHGDKVAEFNSYGSRRGIHEVMMRGTFADVRIRNEMLGGLEGGVTRLAGKTEALSVFDAAMHYRQNDILLVVIAGKEYGTGSSRDWAAKGTRLLGVRAVIVESFERIHRSNLAGMGVLPLQFPSGVSRKTLQLTGDEQISLCNLEAIRPGMEVTMQILSEKHNKVEVPLLCRLDTELEVAYYRSGGIMPYVVGKISGKRE